MCAGSQSPSEVCSQPHAGTYLTSNVIPKVEQEISRFCSSCRVFLSKWRRKGLSGWWWRPGLSSAAPPCLAHRDPWPPFLSASTTAPSWGSSTCVNVSGCLTASPLTPERPGELAFCTLLIRILRMNECPCGFLGCLNLGPLKGSFRA